MRLCLVEDQAVSDLEPLALTRPVFELLLGSRTLGSKIAGAFRIEDLPCRRGAVVRSHLADLHRARDPQMAVNDRAWLAQGPTLVVNGRWVPPPNLAAPAEVPNWLGTCDGLPACAAVTPDRTAGLEPNGIDAWFERDVAGLPTLEVGGRWIRRPWDLVAENAEQLIRDFEAGEPIVPTGRQRSAFALIGPPGYLSIHETAQIDPYTAIDTTQGPVTIDAGVKIQSFTRIEGPCYIGPGTQLFRANLRGGVTLGPACRIGGEIEESIVHGHTNKYHEGFLGHSYVGEWVNLGAITSNSDLRNDYGEVRVPMGGDPVATGQIKVGCFIGDHTRAGMGCMLNTGTVVGVMCNLLPFGRLLPKHIPSFTEIRYGRLAPCAPLDHILETARIVMGRRGRELTAVEWQLLVGLYEQTRLERERAFQRESEKGEDRWPPMQFVPGSEFSGWSRAQSHFL